MNTQAQLLKNFSSLEQEIVNLRSFIIGLAGQDGEGSYKPEFVERILKIGQKPPVGEFTNAQEFLQLIE